MTAALGTTNDPKALVPGDPGAVRATAAAMTGYGDRLHEAGEGLKRIDSSEGWEGEAAEQFRSAFDGEPLKWLEAGDCFHEAGEALKQYSATLAWAQGQAGEAIRLWNEGEAETNRAKAEHAQAVERARQQAPPGAPAAEIPFNDLGEAKRQAAQATLDRARQQLATEGETTADIIAVARDKAPEEQSWLAQAADAVGDAAGSAVNAVASFGNAALNHPELVLGVVGGAALTAVSAAGETVGVALDATGVGAIAGGPLNVVSAAGIVTGVGIAGTAAMALGAEAAGDDEVEVIDTDDAAASAAEDGPFTPEHVDTVEGHLSRLDHAPQNDAMINQVREAMEEGRPLSEAEENFMKHETTEAKLMDEGMPYEDAHEIALQEHPLFKNYSPEVIEKYPEYFNNRWREAWGLPPR